MRSLETTRSGVRIGLAYVPKPCAQQSADAERLQRALLPRPVFDPSKTWLFGWRKA